MRALVLSGGKGSRLRPLTHTHAKQLIPIAGSPILFHALRDIAEAGIRDVGIVVGQTADEVRAAVGDGSRWGLDVTFIHQEEPRGLAHAVLTASSFVQGQPFLMYLGDNVLLEGLTRFVNEFERTRPDAQIFLARVPEPERFGVAVIEGDRVVRSGRETSGTDQRSGLGGGLPVRRFDRRSRALRSSPSWRGELEITEAIQWLVDHGQDVRAQMVEGWWKDTGKPDDLLEANRMMLSALEGSIEGQIDATTVEGAVVIAAGAKVTGSVVRGPVVIGPDAVIDDSTIGPDVSIERGCRIARSEIADSIVMDGCSITDVHGLTGSILGRGVEVRHSGGRWSAPVDRG